MAVRCQFSRNLKLHIWAGRIPQSMHSWMRMPGWAKSVFLVLCFCKAFAEMKTAPILQIYRFPCFCYIVEFNSCKRARCMSRSMTGCKLMDGNYDISTLEGLSHD